MTRRPRSKSSTITTKNHGATYFFHRTKPQANPPVYRDCAPRWVYHICRMSTERANAKLARAFCRIINCHHYLLQPSRLYSVTEFVVSRLQRPHRTSMSSPYSFMYATKFPHPSCFRSGSASSYYRNLTWLKFSRIC